MQPHLSTQIPDAQADSKPSAFITLFKLMQCLEKTDLKSPTSGDVAVSYQDNLCFIFQTLSDTLHTLFNLFIRDGV